MHAQLPPAVHGPAWEQMAGAVSHNVMYVWMVLMPATGIAMGYYGGKGLPFFSTTFAGAETPNGGVAKQVRGALWRARGQPGAWRAMVRMCRHAHTRVPTCGWVCWHVVSRRSLVARLGACMWLPSGGCGCHVTSLYASVCACPGCKRAGRRCHLACVSELTVSWYARS
eukprot:365901-Chlamydomonas_euryale.AAC.6